LLGTTRTQELYTLELAHSAESGQAATRHSQTELANKSRAKNAQFATIVAHTMRREHAVATSKLLHWQCHLENMLSLVPLAAADAACRRSQHRKDGGTYDQDLQAMQQHHKINIRRLSELQELLLSTRAQLKSTCCANEHAQTRKAKVDLEMNGIRIEFAQQTHEKMTQLPGSRSYRRMERSIPSRSKVRSKTSRIHTMITLTRRKCMKQTCLHALLEKNALSRDEGSTANRTQPTICCCRKDTRVMDILACVVYHYSYTAWRFPWLWCV